jgi:carboxyl-terminal processing protease
MKPFGKKLTGAMLVFAMTAGLAGCGSGSGSQDTTESSESSSTGTSASGEFDENSKETEKKVKQIESLIDKYFYFEEDAEKREESYYDGIMAGLDDPYSVYYTPEEFERLQEDDGGEYVGIGATVSKDVDKGTVYVVKPLRGSPAEAAGLTTGDVFVQIDDIEVTADMELDEVVKYIRGKEGTTAHLKMYREGESDYLEIDINRQKIQNITVDYEMLENDIGYISVDQFIENTPEQFKEGMDYLVNNGAKGIVIDMRNNPGGLLTAVNEMTDYILKDDAVAPGASSPGLQLETKDKDGKVIESYSCEDGHSIDLPMVVLVNGYSASAAEIFTGDMKDYGVATIIGTTTYGKGIVQSVIPLSDGSAIKITIAKYFTPSGNDIHKVGIEPDIEIDVSDEQKRMANIPHDEDPQLKKALEVLEK